MNLERKIGPLRIRAWGLVVNFIANFITLYGLARFIAEREALPALVSGAAITFFCLIVLSRPAQ